MQAWSHPSEEQIATARVLLEEARQRELQLRQEAVSCSMAAAASPPSGAQKTCVSFELLDSDISASRALQLRISFNETNAEGEAIKRDVLEIARRLSLPENR